MIIQDDLNTLKSNAVKTLSIQFKNSIPNDLFKNIENVDIVESKENTIKLNITGSIDSVIKKSSQFEIVDIISHEISLENLFMNYYEGK